MDTSSDFSGGIERVPNRLPHDFEKNSSLRGKGSRKITYTNDNFEFRNRQGMLALPIFPNG